MMSLKRGDNGCYQSGSGNKESQEQWATAVCIRMKAGQELGSEPQLHACKHTRTCQQMGASLQMTPNEKGTPLSFSKMPPHSLSPAPSGDGSGGNGCSVSAHVHWPSPKRGRWSVFWQPLHLCACMTRNGHIPLHNSNGGTLLWNSATFENANSLAALESTAAHWHTMTRTDILFWGRQMQGSTARGKSVKQAPLKRKPFLMHKGAQKKGLHNVLHHCITWNKT